MNADFILFILTTTAKITGAVVAILTHLMIFMIKQTFFFLVGCVKLFFATTHQKITAIVLICVCLIDVFFVYRFTNNMKYSEFIHILIIMSPYFYIANIGRSRNMLEKEVHANDR